MGSTVSPWPASGAVSIDMDLDHPATSLGLRCAIPIRPSAIFFQKAGSVFKEEIQ
jgi:hypothetical protein